MNIHSIKLILLFGIGALLTGCSYVENNNPFASHPTEVSAHKEAPLGIEKTDGPSIGLASMDGTDKSKMSHALDSPLGKSTHWVNPTTGIDYTVLPTEKTSVAGNPFCRKYTVTIAKGDKNKETGGTACVGADSNWKTV